MKETCDIAGCKRTVTYRAQAGNRTYTFCSPLHAPAFLCDLLAMMSKPHFESLTYTLVPSRVGMPGASPEDRWQCTIEHLEEKTQ